MNANDRQVGGSHYQDNIQHWDFAAQRQYDYFQGQITKYVDRWKKKNGLQDLLKAQHFLEKYIELVRAGVFSADTNGAIIGTAHVGGGSDGKSRLEGGSGAVGAELSNR